MLVDNEFDLLYSSQVAIGNNWAMNKQFFLNIGALEEEMQGSEVDNLDLALRVNEFCVDREHLWSELNCSRKVTFTYFLHDTFDDLGVCYVLPLVVW